MWTAIPDEFPRLQGRGLVLREMGTEDLPAWLERRQDTEAAALAGDPPVSSLAELSEGLEHHRQAFRRKEGLRWAIVPAGSSRSIGSIGLLGFDAGSASAEIGAVIGRDHWSHGIATRAARLVIGFAFDHLELKSVGAGVRPDNARAIRVLEKLGFVREGGAGDGMIRFRLSRLKDPTR